MRSLMLIAFIAFIASSLIAQPIMAQPSSTEALATDFDAKDIEQERLDFAAANERALARDFGAAISLYQSLLDRGVLHEDVFFNLGNALAASGRRVEAIVAYERALRLAPVSEDIQANLDAVRRDLLRDDGLRSESASATAPDLADTIGPLVAPLPERAFGLLSVGANAILFAALLVRRRAREKGIRRRAVVVLSVALALLIPSLAIVGGHAIVALDRRGVIVEAEPLRDGPHPRFGRRGDGRPGLRVRILSQDGAWFEVQRADGTTGWIPSKSVAEV